MLFSFLPSKCSSCGVLGVRARTQTQKKKLHRRSDWKHCMRKYLSMWILQKKVKGKQINMM